MKDRKKILMIVLPFAFVMVLLAVVVPTGSKKNVPATTLIIPSSPVIPTFVPEEPDGRWATDSAVLEIERKITDLKEKTQKVVLDDSSFLPPEFSFGLGI